MAVDDDRWLLVESLVVGLPPPVPSHRTSFRGPDDDREISFWLLMIRTRRRSRFRFGLRMMTCCGPLMLLLAVCCCASHAHAGPASRSNSTVDILIRANGGALSLSLSPATLEYRVLVGQSAWFDSAGADGGYSFSTDGSVHSLSRKGLTPLGPPVKARGTDSAGAFTSVAISFATAAAAVTDGTVTAAPEWIVTFKAYDKRSAIVFAQKWVKPVAAALGGSTFPSLRAAAAAGQLGTLEYMGASCGFMVGAQGEFPGITGGPDKGYIVIAPRDTDGTGARATLAIGPVTEHFANQARNQNGSLAYGLAPTFETVPAGYELETVLVASSAAEQAREEPHAGARASIPSGGVNGALMEFGDFLLDRHNKTRAQGDHKPETQYIGYSTTAYYFCETRPTLPPVNARIYRYICTHTHVHGLGLSHHLLESDSRANLLWKQTTCAIAWMSRPPLPNHAICQTCTTARPASTPLSLRSISRRPRRRVSARRTPIR